MFCPKCGKEIPDQAVFCPKCGASLSQVRSAAPSGPTTPSAYQAPAAQGQSTTATAVKPKKKGVKKLLLPIAAAIIVLFAAASISGGSSNPSDNRTNEPINGQTDEPADNQASDDMPDEGTAQVAEAMLLDIIGRTEALVEAHDEAFNALEFNKDADGDGMIDDLPVYTEQTRKGVQLLEEFLTNLETLRGEAADITGLNTPLTSARDEYFAMLRAAAESEIETRTFLADYLAFFDETVSWRPDTANYDDPVEYAVALSDWTSACSEGYAAISAPGMVEGEWEQYAKILELNDRIAWKTYAAAQFTDWLRYASALQLTERYKIMENAQYTKMLDCINSEFEHLRNQRNIASRLVQEIHDYAQLDQAAKQAYEFQYNRKGKILLNYDVVETISPALYNTYDAIAVFKTGCISGTRSIVVEAEITGFSQKYRQSFNLDASYKAIYIKPPMLTGDLNLENEQEAYLHIAVYEKDGTTSIDEKTFTVKIKSKYDFDWYSDEYGLSTQDNILCFLTPQARAVNELKVQAANDIYEISGQRAQSFVGYQNIVGGDYGEYATTYLMSAGLMSALRSKGVVYNNDGYSSSSHQHIFFPSDVLELHSGLCIETALTVASALQGAGMHAFLLLPPGHAQVAVEVWDSGNWQGEYFLIETTALEDDGNNPELFAENFWKTVEGYIPNPNTSIRYLSKNEWYSYLRETYSENPYVIDCADAEPLGLTPFVR